MDHSRYVQTDIYAYIIYIYICIYTYICIYIYISELEHNSVLETE